MPTQEGPLKQSLWSRGRGGVPQDVTGPQATWRLENSSEFKVRQVSIGAFPATSSLKSAVADKASLLKLKQVKRAGQWTGIPEEAEETREPGCSEQGAGSEGGEVGTGAAVAGTGRWKDSCARSALREQERCLPHSSPQTRKSSEDAALPKE